MLISGWADNGLFPQLPLRVSLGERYVLFVPGGGTVVRSQHASERLTFWLSGVLLSQHLQNILEFSPRIALRKVPLRFSLIIITAGPDFLYGASSVFSLLLLETRAVRTTQSFHCVSWKKSILDSPSPDSFGIWIKNILLQDKQNTLFAWEQKIRKKLCHHLGLSKLLFK